MPRPTQGRVGLVAAVVLLPWGWFVLRDAHPLLEWVAVLLPLLGAGSAAMLATLSLVLRRGGPVVVAASVLAATVVATAGPWRPIATGTPQQPLRLLAANVLGDNPFPDEVAAELLDADADLLVLSELSPLLALVTRRLDRAYPHSWTAPAENDVSVWSRFPLDGRALRDSGLEGARGGRVVVDGPAGSFALYAMHLYRPSLDAFRNEVTVQQQALLTDQLDRLMRRDDLPAVLAGDLNVTDRSRSYRLLMHNRTDAARSSWTGPTSLRARNRPLLLRIDHVLLPGDWCSAAAKRHILTGSDHLGVSADVGPCTRGPDSLLGLPPRPTQGGPVTSRTRSPCGSCT